MSFVGSMFQDSRGAGYQAGDARILDPVSTDREIAAQNKSMEALAQQQAFVNALQGQNGLGNQSSVFNQQQALANQMQGVANGTGPNPALAQLNQTTGNNIANQAALMAGQRGSNANAGLMARQAAMMGGNLQQQAVGQGATLQAQQQLAAMNALQNQQASMGNLASQQVNQQGTAVQGLTGNTQQQQQMLLNSIAAQNNAHVGMQSNINAANSNIANTNTKGQQQMFGGFMNSLMNPSTGASTGGMMTKSGFVRAYADGGEVSPQDEAIPVQTAPAPQTPVVQAAPMYLENASMPPMQAPAPTPTAMSLVTPPTLDMPNKPQSFVAQALQPQAPVDATPNYNDDDSKGEAAMFKAGGSIPNGIKKSITGGITSGTSLMGGSGGSSGGGSGGMLGNIMGMIGGMNKGGPVVPGKAVVKGDNPVNDNVPAVLSPGEIVIPRSIAQHANAPELAAEFVKKVLANSKKKSGNFADGGEVDDDAEVAAAMQAKEPPAESVEPTAPQAAPAPQNLSPDYTDKLAGDYNKQKQDVLNLGKLQGQASLQAANAIGQNISDIQKQFEIDQAKLADVDAQRQAFQNDVINAKIDPNRFVNNQSLGQRVMTTIGLMLGGIGSGLAGQQNNALAYLNKQIDNDIDAQKADIGKKQNLLTANMQQFKDIRDAQAMTKAHMLDIAKLKLEQIAAQSNDPIVRQRAALQADQIGLLADQTIGPLKYKQQVLGMAALGSADADPVTLVQHIVPPASQGKVIEQIAKAKHITENLDSMMKNFDQVAKDSRFMTGGRPLYGTVLTSPSKKVMASLEDPILKDEFGKVNPIVQKGIEDLHPKWGDSDEAVQIKRKAYKQFIMDKLIDAENTAKAHNINLKNYSATNPIRNALKKAGPNAEAMLMWAQKNPSDPRAQLFLKKIGAVDGE